MNSIGRLLLLVLALCTHRAFAVEISIGPDYESQAAPPGIQYLEDETRRLSLIDVLNMKGEVWHESAGAIPTFGYSSSAYWVRFDVVNAGAQAREALIELAYPVLNQVDIHVVRSSGHVSTDKMGSHQPVKRRPYPHRNFVLPVELAAHERVDVYIRVQTTSSIQLPITIWSPQAFLIQDNVINILYGAYLGLAIIMLAYNLKLLIGTRDLSYFYYVCWVFGMAGFVSSLHGLSLQYLWPTHVDLNNHALVFLVIGIVASAAKFSSHFLDISQAMPQRVRWVNVVLWGNGLAALASMVVPYSVMIRVAIVSAVLTTALIGHFSIQRWIEGYRPARYFAISYALVLLGGVAMSLTKFGVIDRSVWTEHSVTIGSALEIVLLNLALADRHNAERHARARVQRELYEWQQKQQGMLEEQVAARTQELELANWQLQQHVKRISRLQTGSELGGTLIHELRQPLAALQSFAQGALTALTTHQDPASLTRVLEKMVDTAKRGNVMLDRMRAFLVQGTETIQPFDLNESIREALVWVRPTCKQSGVAIEIHGIQDQALMALGDSVLVQQIIVNLVRNAVDAMVAADSDLKRIKISTSTDGNVVQCRIHDSGPGVPVDVRQRIFEGGASTKQHGLGLGLKLSRSIAIEMRGDLAIESVADGACFVLSLLAQKHLVSDISAS